MKFEFSQVVFLTWSWLDGTFFYKSSRITVADAVFIIYFAFWKSVNYFSENPKQFFVILQKECSANNPLRSEKNEANKILQKVEYHLILDFHWSTKIFKKTNIIF